MVVILHLAFTDIMSGYKTDGVDLIEGCFPRRLAASWALRKSDNVMILGRRQFFCSVNSTQWLDRLTNASPATSPRALRGFRFGCQKKKRVCVRKKEKPEFAVPGRSSNACPEDSIVTLDRWLLLESQNYSAPCDLINPDSEETLQTSKASIKHHTISLHFKISPHSVIEHANPHPNRASISKRAILWGTGNLTAPSLHASSSALALQNHHKQTYTPVQGGCSEKDVPHPPRLSPLFASQDA